MTPLNSAAHEEMIDFFDRQHKGMRLDKETKEMWRKGRIYQNDETNNLFLAFREGVAMADMLSATAEVTIA